MRKKICCVIGTRPEAIKMAPVIWALKAEEWAEVQVWVTAQHRDMLDPLIEYLGITVDRDFDVMRPNQTLFGLNASILDAMGKALSEWCPDLVIVQGDTTTVMAAATAAFYLRIPIAHVEAGLRTGDIKEPFPEEYNRCVVGKIARFHFAPTPRAASALLNEGVSESSLWITGNTVIDTLHWTARRVSANDLVVGRQLLVTLHRRENFGQPLESIFDAVERLLSEIPDLKVVYPVHPNPNVSLAAKKRFSGNERVSLLEPLPYPDMVRAMIDATVILTDSGGVQEEAPGLGKPVFVARTATERPEAVEAGCAVLVGADSEFIYQSLRNVLTNSDAYDAMIKGGSPYGDGKAAEKITAVLREHFACD